MATIVEITNPFEPFEDTRVTQHPGGISIREWLELRFPGFIEFERPTIILVNGTPILRKDWCRTIQRDDVVNIITNPGAPLVILLIVLIVVAAVVMVMSIKTPVIGDTPAADPVYSLKGQRNQIRLGEPIECPYGRTRMWPSFAAMPYNEYQNNEQWLYQLFVIGQGSYVIESVNIEDTPIANFSDVTYEIIPPGGAMTLFPDNVVTSVEVANIELFAPNQPESGGGGTTIIDSPGDEDFDMPAQSHVGYSPGGSTPAFVVNPAFTQTNLIKLDVSLPRGLYKSADDGNLTALTVTATFEAREIDDTGAAIGSWFSINSFSKTLSTVTPQRYTLACTVPAGRYQVRGYRTNNKDLSARAGHVLQWEALRAFLPSTTDFGDITMMAVKARASNNLNDNASSRINVVGVRMLPYWSAGAWQAPAPTRSIVWAFCDIYRNQTYGGRLGDAFLDMTTLAALDTLLDSREEYCDWIFEQRLTCWEAARLVAMLGRAIPMLNGSRITMVRSEAKTLPTAIFNQENITSGSFRSEIKLDNFDAFDGLEVEYTDPNTWKTETVVCLLSGDAGDNLEKVKLNGCTDRTHAYRWGMWKRAMTKFQREQINFGTGLEGHIPSYGDLIGVTHDVLRYGTGGFVTAVDVTNTILTLSEPVEFEVGQTYKIVLRQKNGETTVPITCTAGVDEFHVVLASALTPANFNWTLPGEPPLFNFGLSAATTKLCLVSNLSPSEDDTVSVNATVYRPEPHTYDEYTPPAIGGTVGSGPTRPALPSVTGFLVTKSSGIPNEVIATWNAARGANYYVLQLSYDGTAWETVSDNIIGTTFRFTMLPKYVYVRISAVTTGQGPWVYWVGNAPVVDTNIIVEEDTVPDPVTGIVLTAGFGQIWLKWVDPTNVSRKKIKAIHIYITTGSATGWDTKPVGPTYSVQAGQQFWSDAPLADNVRRNYWFNVETYFGLFSTDVGPVNATSVNGITLDHLIPGGIQPVELVDTLPATGNYQGRQVFLRVDQTIGITLYKKDKLYKWIGTGTYAAPDSGTASWVASVEAVDITGQLTDSQLSAIAAAKISGTLTDAQLATISAAKITGTLTDAQLAAISAAKITGTLTDSQLAAIAAAKITGTLSDSQLAAIAAAKITGTLTSAQIASLDAAKLTGTITATAVAAAGITGQLSNSQIADLDASKLTGTIVATTVADNSITTPKLAAGSITTSKLAAGAVTANEIAADAITAGKIAAGAITTAKLAANAVTANELAANSITAGKIAAGTIVAADIAASAITTTKLAAGAVTASEIAAGAITTGKLAAGAVTATEIAAGAITAGKIATGAIVAGDIAASAITTAKIAAGAVTAAEIAAGAIVAGKIAASAVTATELAAGSVVAGKIATGAIVAGDIAAGAITTPKLAAGAVTAAEIAAGAIIAGKIAAGAIVAADISAGAVTTSKLAAGAVTTSELAADAVVAGKIAAGAIVAAAIGTNEIIALSANIKDGIITTAKIANLDANKINAGTLSTMKLDASLIRSDVQLYNADDTTRMFPVVGSVQTDLIADLSGAIDISTLSIYSTFNYFTSSNLILYGWKQGAAGFNSRRMGNNVLRLSVAISGNCTPSGTNVLIFGPAYRTRVSGGSWGAWTGTAHDNYAEAGGAAKNLMYALNYADINVSGGDTDVQLGVRFSRGTSGVTGGSIGALVMSGLSYNF